MAKFQDLSGQKFNRLTVIRRDESVLNKVSWICKCECGNEISVTTSHLKCGHTQSCGCLQKEKAREANLKHCLPIGKPIIVIHHITPEKNQQIPCHNPPHKNQIIFPRQPIIKSPN